MFKLFVVILTILSVLSCRKDEISLNIEENFEIYPSPFENELFVNAKNSQTYNITIYDKVGQIYFYKDSLSFGKVKFDLSILPTGLYFIRINTISLDKIYKIIKQ